MIPYTIQATIWYYTIYYNDCFNTPQDVNEFVFSMYIEKAKMKFYKKYKQEAKK